MNDRPDSTDNNRPQPGQVGSVVASTPAPDTTLPGAIAAETEYPLPPIKSTLVGEGGTLQAMDKREPPLRLGQAAGTSIWTEPTPVEADAAEDLLDTGGHDPEYERVEVETEVETFVEPEPEPEPVHSEQAAERAEPVYAPPPPPPAPVQTVIRRGGFFPMFLGGVVSAGLGAGAAYYAIPHLPAAWQPQAPVAGDSAAATEAALAAVRSELDTRAAAIETRAAEVAAKAAADAAQSASLANGASLAVDPDSLLDEARKAGADAAAKLIAEAPATAQPNGDVETTLAAQAQQLAALDERVTELNRPTVSTTGSVDLAPIEQQIAELSQRPTLDAATVDRLNRLAAEADAATARINDAAAAAEARLDETESRAEALTTAADEAARRAAATAAAAALGDAVQTGAPREAALAQLQDAGIAPPAALTAEVPSLDALIAEFPDAAREAVRADLRDSNTQGQGSLIGNFLRAQTGARSITPRDGTDADAVLSRVGDAVSRGEITEALTELDALPAASRPAMEAWAAKARAYAEAQAAVSALTAPAPAAPAAASPATPSN